MSNVLVMGVGPLPHEDSEKLHAPGLRTWQIADLLAQRRHHVTIAIIEFGDFQPGKKGEPANKREDLGNNMTLVRLRYQPEQAIPALNTLRLANRFSCIISTTDIMNALAVQIDGNLPLWLDYNGDPFAEKQLQGLVHGNDATLLDQWKLYLKGLAHGDRFSCASTMQRHAIIGQLAFSGRLNQHTCGEDLVHTIPNCSRAMDRQMRKRNFGVKGHMIPQSAFMVLWTGGYNTWCDPTTLFHGLRLAMESDELIHFVSTGGGIAGHNTRSFDDFMALVESSPLSDRFHFIGWRATDEVVSIYQQADVTVCVDRYSVEGELGTRTRLVDWLQFDLPIVTTNLCELTHQLADRELIETFPIGSAEGLKDALLRVRANPSAAKQRAQKARQFFEKAYMEEEAFAPLLSWAASPAHAGDRIAADPKQSELTKFHLRHRSSPAAASSAGKVRGLIRRLLPGR